MGHGIASESARRRGVLADGEPVRCGAMMQQDCGPGLQSWPQQFVRLVGGYHRPAPERTAPALAEALTG
jgi:hypothetical protein